MCRSDPKARTKARTDPKARTLISLLVIADEGLLIPRSQSVMVRSETGVAMAGVFMPKKNISETNNCVILFITIPSLYRHLRDQQNFRSSNASSSSPPPTGPQVRNRPTKESRAQERGERHPRDASIGMCPKGRGPGTMPSPPYIRV